MASITRTKPARATEEDSDTETPTTTDLVDERNDVETVDAEDPEDAQSDSKEPLLSDRKSRAERRWTRHARNAAVGLIIAAALTGVGLLGWTVWQQRQVTHAAADAQQAAATYAQVLTSVDSARIDQNFNDVLNGATGEFKDMYTQASVQLRQLLLDNKASAHGVVLESAVQSATTSKVVVLLFVDQSISNTNVPDPRIDRSRVKITMEKVDDQWRASKVELP